MIVRCFVFFRLFFAEIFSFALKLSKRASYQLQNPTCRFYSGAGVYDAKLEGYNILFYDAQVISSTIGKHTYVQKRTAIVNASIGKFCSIASNVSIGPGIHKIDGVSTHPAFYLKNNPLVKTYATSDLYNSSKRTIIGDDVWIGEGVIVIDGVKIGTGAIVAAGAVVVNDVESYSIVGGVPAKHIKYRFDAETIEVLNKSQWWNNSEDWFEENYKSMSNISDFKNILNKR